MTLSLLRENASFRSLWSARTVSFLGDSLGLVALMLYVADSAGQALAVALLLLAGDFTPSLLSPFTGTISDRFDRKRVMVTCDLAQAGIVAIIALTMPSLPFLLALVALRALVGQVFGPASRAAVPDLVRDRDLESANSTLGLGTYGSDALGPLLAAALFPFLDVRGVLIADVATFLVSALLLSRLPALPPSRGSDGADGSSARAFVGDAKAGLTYIWSARAVRALVIGFFAVVALSAVDDVALVFLGRDTLNAGPSAVSLLLAAVGIGLLAGYLLLAGQAWRCSMVVLFLVGLGLNSAGNLLTGLAWAVSAAFVMQAIRGLGIAAMEVGSNTLLQRLVPSAMLGRVFGNLGGAIGVAAALSYVLGGVLLDQTSPRFVLVVAGAGGLLAAVATALVLPRRLGPAP